MTRYTLQLFVDPQGRTPTPYHTEQLTNKRNAIRRARKLLMLDWNTSRAGAKPAKLIRASVRTADRLLYQARIDEDSAKNGTRKAVVDEEL